MVVAPLTDVAVGGSAACGLDWCRDRRPATCRHGGAAHLVDLQRLTRSHVSASCGICSGEEPDLHALAGLSALCREVDRVRDSAPANNVRVACSVRAPPIRSRGRGQSGFTVSTGTGSPWAGERVVAQKS